MSANDRTGVGAGSAEWGTPPDLFANLNARFRFDYDAFASHKNTLARAMRPSEVNAMYSTIDGTFGVYSGAYDGEAFETACYKVNDADGLTMSWAGRRVFMNPPYSRGLIEQCVEKAYSERESALLIVALLPAATETRWFQRHILDACHIDWLPRRVHYIDPATGQPGGSPPSGAVIATFKRELMPTPTAKGDA